MTAELDNKFHMSVEDLERHSSPDGLLKLVICCGSDGDVSLGFEGYQWHTHADLLVPAYGTSPKDAVRQLVDDILSGRAIIAVARIDNAVHEVWLTDTPEEDLQNRLPEESVEFRNWSGTKWSSSKSGPQI